MSELEAHPTPLSLIGTLVVAIPTRNGFIVAADSRGVVEGEVIDGRKKLHTVQSRPSIVFAITGAADFPAAPPTGVSRLEWLKEDRYMFRGSDIVRSYLMGKTFTLKEDELLNAARVLGGAVSAFLRTWPRLLAVHEGRPLCCLAMYQVEPESGDCLFGSVVIHVDRGGESSLSEPNFRHYREKNQAEEQLVGEGDYVINNVYRDPGRKYLRDDALSFILSRPQIEDLDAVQAARIAASIIKASELTTELIPIPSGSGIGGPVTCLLVSREFIQPVQVDRI